MRPYLVALVMSLCALAAALGLLVGMQGIDPLRAGANAATRQQVYTQCMEDADRLTEGVEDYGEYESRVPDAIAARAECERLYGSTVREGTVEAQGWKGER